MLGMTKNLHETLNEGDLMNEN